MKFTMNIYVTHRMNKGFDLLEEFVKRLNESDLYDLEIAIQDNYYNDEKKMKQLLSMIRTVPLDQIVKCINIDENSLAVDVPETLEYGLNNGIAYFLYAECNTDKLLNMQ